MLAPVRTVAPAELPVSLEAAKANLHVAHDEENALITALISSATAHLDGWSGTLGRAIVTQTWRQDFTNFDMMRLALLPVASVASVKYFDDANVERTLSDTVYRLLTDARGPHVVLKPDQTWPSIYSRVDAVSVTYVAGAAPADLDPRILQAIQLLVAHWYENREAVVTGTIATELPFAVKSLLAPLCRVGI